MSDASKHLAFPQQTPHVCVYVCAFIHACVCVLCMSGVYGAFKTTGNASVGSLNLQVLQAAHLLREL